MPSTTLLEIPPAEQVQMRAVLRRTRYGYLLAFHILLLCAAGRNPTEIAAFLFCSRSSVYRIVHAYRTGSLGIRVDPDGQRAIAVQATIFMPWLTRSLGTILKKAPRAYGWCRTRWSCATLAATLQAKHGIEVSAETVRRWLHGCDRSIPNSTGGCETLDSQAAPRFRLINDFRLARGPLWWNGGCAQPPSFLS